ncbi:hypothetical protein ACFOVU_10295, partial [Nocardiopsis sediminis]
VDGASATDAVDAAMAELPADTAIGATARAALALPGDDPFALVPAVEEVCCDHVYSYGVAAAATVPAALALTRAAGGALGPAVSAAATLMPLADSLPALTGALAGALGGHAAQPGAWRERARRLSGCCLPELAGQDLVAIADTLADATDHHDEGVS